MSAYAIATAWGGIMFIYNLKNCAYAYASLYKLIRYIQIVIKLEAGYN